MPGNKFLNPILKIVLCVIGMVVLGYFLYPSLVEGAFHDRMTLVRLLTFLGFAYLLVRSVRELTAR